MILYNSILFINLNHNSIYSVTSNFNSYNIQVCLLIVMFFKYIGILELKENNILTLETWYIISYTNVFRILQIKLVPEVWSTAVQQTRGMSSYQGTTLPSVAALSQKTEAPESQGSRREDWRKAKELEEARKAGTAPALVDEEGK